MRTLIDICYDDSEMREALKDIMAFKKSSLQRFGREEIEILEDSGFEFGSTYVTQRKNELMTFLSQHPECCSQDYETMIDKITYFCAKQSEMQREKKKKQRQRMKEIAEKNKSRGTPKKAKRSRASSKVSDYEEEETED